MSSPVDVCLVQPPGRQGRWREKPIPKVDGLARAACEALGPFLDRPFAFFGHSLGALLSFELARLLRREGGPMPAHLFLSGHRAPQLDDRRPPTYDLPDEEFRAELRRLDGTPPQLLENAELLSLMMPLLRADFEAAETYSFRPEPALETAFSVFGGESDEDVTRDDLDAWRLHTCRSFELNMLEGGHFFLHSNEERLLQLLDERLSLLLP